MQTANAVVSAHLIKLTSYLSFWYTLPYHTLIHTDFTDPSSSHFILHITQFYTTFSWIQLFSWIQTHELSQHLDSANLKKRKKINIVLPFNYHFAAESLTVEYAALIDCDVYKVGQDFGLHSLAFPISKNTRFSLKSKLDFAINKLKKQGVIEALRQKYWVHNSEAKVCKEFRQITDGLDLYYTGGLFLVLLIGIILSLLTLALENYLLRWKQFGVHFNLKSVTFNCSQNGLTNTSLAVKSFYSKTRDDMWRISFDQI